MSHALAELRSRACPGRLRHIEAGNRTQIADQNGCRAVRGVDHVLAHATSSFAMGALQTAAILVAASLLFDVHLDLVSLFLLLVVAYLVFLGMGLAISGWIKDPQRASGVAQSIAFPMIFIALLSAALPPGIAAITKYLPVSYVTDGMQQLGQGANLGGIEVDLVWLFAWAIALLIAAGRVFRWD